MGSFVSASPSSASAEAVEPAPARRRLARHWRRQLPLVAHLDWERAPLGGWFEAHAQRAEVKAAASLPTEAPDLTDQPPAASRRHPRSAIGHGYPREVFRLMRRVRWFVLACPLMPAPIDSSVRQ